MSKPSVTANIIDNPSKNRFEAEVEGHTAEVVYKLDGQVITFDHTTIPEPLQGRGLAGQMAQACLASARERGLSIMPECPVFVNYMKKRPETHDLLTEEGRKKLEIE